MNWSRVLQRQGWSVPQTDSGSDIDPFSMLNAMADPKTGSVSRVGVGIKAGGYGEVFVNVSIECPQNEVCINLAGEVAFRKAVELANDGASQLGVAGYHPLED